jgi:hypothetical protein
MFPLRGPKYQLPPPDPDSPPDSRDLGGPCPRCGRTSTFELLGKLPLTVDGTMRTLSQGDSRFEGEIVGQIGVGEQVSMLMCRGCFQGVAVVEERWVGDEPAVTSLFGGSGGGGTVNYRGVFWYPPASIAGLDEAIPETIRKAFAEGAKCLAVRAPRGAAVMFRRTLEAIVTDKGSAAAKKAIEKDLATGLKVMADEGTLDASIASWAKEVRLAGNAGGHYDVLNDVTIEEATDLSKLVRAIFLFIYETPAKVRRSLPKPVTTP